MNRNWSETFYKLATFLLAIGLVAVGVMAISYLRDVLSILISAMLIAYILQLGVEPLSRRMPRYMAVGLVVGLFIVLAAVALGLVVPMVLNQVQMLVGHLPNDLVNVQNELNQFSERLATRHLQVDMRVDTWLLPRLEGIGQNVATNLPGLLMGSFSGFFSMAMILVCAFYFLKDGARLWASIVSLLPRRAAQQAEYLRVELDRSLSRYLRGQLINACLVLVTASSAFTVLGMSYGIVAGLIWGTAEIIPYFGLYLGLGTALILAGLQGGPVVGKVLLAGLLIWWTKDNIVAPRVMSHTTGLHPVLIIAAVLTGGKLAGFLGVLLAIPVTAVLATTVRFYLLQLREREGAVTETILTEPQVSPPSSSPR